NKPASTNGTLRADSPENFIGDSTRWLVFEGNGKSLVFDFNPEGVQTYSDFGPNRIQGLWTVKKIGDYVEFSFGRNSSLSGGTLSSKLVIFEGGFDDYVNSHAYPKYAYYSKLPVTLNFCFGAPKYGAGFIQAGNKPFNESKGFGWSGDVEVNSIRPSGALYSAAHGTKPATFKCAVPQPGVYLVTARVGTGEQSAGPFSVSVPGKDIAKDITVSPQTAKTVIWPQWIENGTAEFTFSGNWRISSIALQLLQHAKEDYTFRRGFWRISDFYEPSIMLKNSYHAKPPEFKVAISETPLPMAEIKDTDKAVPLPTSRTCLPDQQSPAMAWRFNANIGSMGPGNWGNFDEFNTKELVQRRLSEIEKSKIDTILLNGNHSRHTFPDLAEHTDREIKRIVTEAHQKNIKVIDHMELNLLWNMGSGFRYLTEHTDWLERTVDDGVPTTVLCPVKPAFKKQFFDRWIKHIKDTGIDGFMIDEETFAGADFCGCDECRRQFHAATGLTLPLDETSPLLKNKDSNLWKSWLNWRIKIISDWCVELKEQTKLINPNLTFMRYTTHYGFYSNYSTHDVGASLSENARGCDFLGTEIMSRNVMESCRGVYAFRKLKYSLREAYGSPIFGLVYPQGSMGLAYFGWALNNMNNQATWFMEEISPKDDVPDFTAFTGNMDRRLAAPAAETAILFSTQSRDWAKMLPYYVDPFGFCQTMNDLHRQYTVLIEPSLNQEKLRQYQTLIAPSASSLSDAQIAEMLTFAENGGTLVLTAHAGMFDEMGNAREIWPFAKALGIANPIPTKSLSGGTLKLSGGNSQTETQSVFFKLTPSGEKTKALATLNGETVGVETPYGKGRIFYISGQIGRLNMEDERTYTQKWTFTWDQSAYELQKEVLNTILGE
ncbi:MAG: beta-galactosidase trimerization domain-containing protein, partial [Verrucomicrobia bacterium]|nr:beta-galactosidase trimerization domain-containing protein [Verrucomicrobiota bacterium]